MAVAHEAMHEEHRLGFIQRYIFSQDHKIIGIQYMMTSLFMAGVCGGPPHSGGTASPPLSALRNAAPGSGLGQTLWLVSVAILIVSFLFGSLNYITTVLQLRTRGMSMGRMPLVTWAQFTTAILMLLAFPVLFAAVVMLLFYRHLGTSFFVPSGLVVGGQLVP